MTKKDALEAVTRAALALGKASLAGSYPLLDAASQDFQAALAAAREAGCTADELVIAVDAGTPRGIGGDDGNA